MKHSIFFAVVAVGLPCVSASADTVVFYNFNNSSANPTTMVANASASAVTVRNADGSTSFQADRSGNADGAFSTTAFANSAGNAFLFSVTVADGFKLDLSGFSVFPRASTTGPGTSNLFVNGDPVGSFTNPTAFATSPRTIDLAISGLTGTTDFSLVGTGSGTDFRNTGSLRLDDLTVSGNVSPVSPVSAVPSPSAVSAVALLGLLATRRCRSESPL